MSTMPNRYPGSCAICGAKVATGAGTYSRATGVTHKDGEHNTATKTYRRWVRGQRFDAWKAQTEALHTDAGCRRWFGTCIEHATHIDGNGIHATLGGYQRDAVFADGLIIHRNGAETARYDQPRIETGDFYADQLAQTAAIIALLNQRAAIAA